MLFFRRMAVVASREAHVKLYVNNSYAGLYTIVESVDRTFLGKHFESDEGFLYKYDYNPGDTPYYFEYKGPDAPAYVPLPFKPETHESDPQPAAIVRHDPNRCRGERRGVPFADRAVPGSGRSSSGTWRSRYFSPTTTASSAITG